MTSPHPAIQFEGLTRRFRRTTAVDGLTLNVPRGATLGLLGPNGAGKSTTLRMLMGILRPTAGVVRVLGDDISQSAAETRQRIGYVPESHHIYRWMSVADAIRFSRAMYHAWNQERAAELLDLFELPSGRRVRALSKGMLAKLSLLIALAHEPELLVLDEPLSGLDPIARDDFIDGVLQGICGGDRTVLFSSHQLDEVNRLADSVAIMHAGRLLVHQPVEDLLNSTRRVTAVLRDGRLPLAPPENTVWQRVNRREWLLTIYPFSDDAVESIRSSNPVDDVRVADLSLDDVFRDFVRGTTCSVN